MFRLHVLQARYGDCLLLEFGTAKCHLDGGGHSSTLGPSRLYFSIGLVRQNCQSDPPRGRSSLEAGPIGVVLLVVHTWLGGQVAAWAERSGDPRRSECA